MVSTPCQLAQALCRGRRWLAVARKLYIQLGRLLARQKDALYRGEDCADDGWFAANLAEFLKDILAGRNPNDFFVRWKPLSGSQLDWEPTLMTVCG
jgi:hypothetical protein